MSTHWRLSLILLLPVWIFSCGSQNLPAQQGKAPAQEARQASTDIANLAQTAMEQGKYTYALNLCDSALALHAGNAHGFWVRSVVHIKQGHYPEAFEALNRATELDPQGHLGYRGWIKLHYFRDLEGALHDFNAIIRIDSLDGLERWGSYLSRGVVCHLKGDQEAAIRDLQFYIKKTGEDWAEREAFEILARAFFAAKRLNKAKQTCERGLKLYQKQPELWFLKGEINHSLGNGKEACHCWKQALNHAKAGYLQTWPYGRRLHQLNEPDIAAALNEHCR